jgi:arsenical pump membrane protein
VNYYPGVFCSKTAEHRKLPSLETPVLRIALGLVIFAATLVLILIRPFRLTEAVIAAGGGLLMLVCRVVDPGDAIQTVLSQWNIYGFFLGMMLIFAVADSAGVFDVLAYQAARIAGGSSLRLYLAIFAVGVLITAFLSNDATALILTPVVYALVTRLRLPALPLCFPARLSLIPPRFCSR